MSALPCLSESQGIYSPSHVAMCGVTPEPVRRLTVGRLGRFSFYLRTKTRKKCTRDPVRDISFVMSLTSRHCLPRQPVDFSTQTPGNGVEPTLHPLHRLLYTLLYREYSHVSVVIWQTKTLC
jgi:hypothetical protein